MLLHLQLCRTSRAAQAAALLLFLLSPRLAALAEDASAIESRLSATAKYLSSEELEGRGVGTKGLDLAADYIAKEFKAAGLKTELYDGGPFQKFTMSTGATLGMPNELALVGPPAAEGKEPSRIELKLGSAFTPLALGGSKKFDLPLVFVGYGITGNDEKYDDYAGIDVKDKAVVILRHEPQQNNPHSAFNGTSTSRHAPFSRKVSNAYEHGAAAVIFCNDAFDVHKGIVALRTRWQAAVDQIAEESAKFKAVEKPSDDQWSEHEKKIQKLADDVKKYSDQLVAAQDPILSFSGGGSESGEGRDFPVLFCQRRPLDQMVQAAMHTTLAELETAIDKDLTPRSHALEGWRAQGETNVQRQEVEVKNVVGVLEGEGPHADETIVIGAHYDHLGFGGAGSASPGVHEIHNGADDNGSGSTVLVEVARAMAAGKKPQRRIVFIAFTGEERGLIGSARYVRNPLFPLDKTVAMLNLDMVGRLTDDKLIVHGTGTASEFDALVDRFGKEGAFQITKKPSGFGPSDHSSFYAAKVPVLFFFTGSHKDYHRPTDDFDKLNIAGMRRVAQLVVEVAQTLADAAEPPHYLKASAASETLGGGGDRPYFGSIPDFSQDQPGYALSGVTQGGPAEKAGLKAGDIIVQFGESKVGNLEDFDSALRKFKAGDKVPIVIKRGAEQVKLDVTLDPPK